MKYIIKSDSGTESHTLDPEKDAVHAALVELITKGEQEHFSIQVRTTDNDLKELAEIYIRKVAPLAE